MFVSLLSLLANAVMGVPIPQTLDSASQQLSVILPEGRVLDATTQRQENAPHLVQKTLGPDISAQSYVVLDVATGKVLTAKDASMIRPVASLTKLLTALTVLAHASPDDIVTVGADPPKEAFTGSIMGLKMGEQITVRNLLAGLLIHSSNDAAVALAEHVSGTEPAFAEQMNAVASSMGLARTHMANATGLDNPAHYSSAYDMAQLLARAWKDPLLGIYLRAESMDVSSVDNAIVHHLKTTDRLLGNRTDILAGKTGFTDEAGQSLAILAENDQGNPVVAVLLGSQDRFGDMNNLLNWTFWAYAWPPADASGAPSPSPQSSSSSS